MTEPKHWTLETVSAPDDLHLSWQQGIMLQYSEHVRLLSVDLLLIIQFPT